VPPRRLQSLTGEFAGIGASFALGGALSLNGGAQSVFYSGEGALAAARMARSGTILGETIGGRVLNLIDRQMPLPRVVWDGASAIFAANARGEAQAFLRNPLLTGTWSRVERPILEFLGNARIIVR
jgi:hypothetical protein